MPHPLSRRRPASCGEATPLPGRGLPLGPPPPRGGLEGQCWMPFGPFLWTRALEGPAWLSATYLVLLSKCT